MDHDQNQQKSQKLQVVLLPSSLTIIKRERVFTCIFLIIILVSSLFIFDFSTVPFYAQSFFRLGFLSQKIMPHNNKRFSRDCDYSNGKWVRDENYKYELYNEDCPFLDPGFQCRRRGRKDYEYLNWRWQPEGCNIPRFNASDLLERSRNGRIVFAGDSIGRNQWESFLCMLSQGVSNKSTIYEVNGKPISKHKGFLWMRFADHNLTVEYYRTPFLVSTGRAPDNAPVHVKSTIKVDLLHRFATKWVGANVMVFNAGHWWNKDKTAKKGFYFEYGGEVKQSMNVMEAFQRSIQTWKLWAMKNLDPEKSHLFFRSYSPVHFRNGTWNEGGRCDIDTQPDSNYQIHGGEPENNQMIMDEIKQMDHIYKKVHLLNITYLSMFRYDGHPSKYREPPIPQDCSHWCLPGTPDIWNEILYSRLVSMGFRTR